MGQLTMRHGATSAVIPQSELSAEGLSSAIRHTFDAYERYQERAQTMAAMIQSEAGAKSAASTIETAVHREWQSRRSPAA